MEETTGLGFNSHRGGIAGVPTAFVSASVSDLKDGKSINLVRGTNNGNNYSSATMPENEVMSSSSQSANIMHMQQHNQQHWQHQVHQPPMMPPPLHNMQPTFSPPTSSTLREISSQSFPPLINPPIPNPSSIFATQQYSLPSFEPPPGMPPVAFSSFPPPITNNMAPSTSIPPHTSVPYSLPPHPGAPFIPAQIPSQHSQQQYEQPQPQSNPIEKALAIAMRFHQEKETIIDTSIDPTINYAQKRLEHFQQEHRKLQAFQLKNLEYVMKHEQAALRRHVDCMNQMTAYEERQQLQLQLQQQQQQRQVQLQLEQKQQRKDQLYGEGGIGSKEQRRAERTRVRKRQTLEHDADDGGGGGSSTTNTTNKALRTSIYLSNLPIDGSTTERTLQSLFCSYGRLDRVTMYRCRSTGEWKGDGLIVFGRDAVGEYRRKNGDGAGADLVEAVCTQMNTAELPCGTAIGVQPADTDYKKKKSTNAEETTHQQPTSIHGNRNSVESSANSVPSDGATKLTSPTTAAAAVNMATISGGSEDKNAKEDDDDDLDDFFASLE